MNKDNFYKRLENIARETFGDFNVNLHSMEADENGRGGNPDDIVYVLSNMEENADDGVWNAKKLQYVIRAVKLYIEEYCNEHNIEVPSIYMRPEGNYLHIIKCHQPEYIEDVKSIDILFALTTFSKERIDNPIDDIVPMFIKQPFEFNCNLKIDSIIYKDNEVSVTYIQK
jgi:hypothetical protein